MSSTIRKILIFVAEPMGEKPVIDLAGIGEVLGKGLVNHGFDRAYIVPGQFLLLKDNELFVDWLVDLIHCNVKQASDCWQCLNDWCAEHLKFVCKRVGTACVTAAEEPQQNGRLSVEEEDFCVTFDPIVLRWVVLWKVSGGGSPPSELLNTVDEYPVPTEARAEYEAALDNWI
ncbi:barrier-to-autointegration factor-like [Pollicipes pollicipes]|uniref:barrier-to-autointegration factor-like n=1 Tax=Pollicipes pollicipes TaxID=41117 RepID=UPI0018856760|nr:barrier-to-autointegration factor-like [Pollicipes pollicipes]